MDPGHETVYSEVDVNIRTSMTDDDRAPSVLRRSRLRGSLFLATNCGRIAARQEQLEGKDMAHLFRSGQSVRLNRGFANRTAPEGLYQVVKQLPDNGGDPQYRIKSAREPHERVVKESDLERA